MSNLENQSQPTSAEIDSLIGYYKIGQLKEAISLAQNLLSLHPQNLILHEILGAANMGQGNVQEAIENYKKVLHLNPKHTDAYNNMGMMLYEQGKFSQAIEKYQRAIKLEPDFADAHYNLANAFHEVGELEKAAYSFKISLKINPDDAEVLSNLGNALKDLGEFDQAIECYKKALKIEPNHAPAYNNMGIALQNQGTLLAAINSYKQAIKIRPKYAEAFNNMGNSLQDMGELESAIDSYKQAIKIKPDYAEAFNNLGTALQEKGQRTAAINSYDRAVRIKPDYEAPLIQKLHQQAHICDWRDIEESRKLIPNLGLSKWSADPFCFLSLEDAPERHRARTEIYVQETYKQKPLSLSSRPLQKPTQIRIGYFSADFKQHPVAYLMAKVIETHNRNDFKIYGYSLRSAQDNKMTQRLTKAFDIFTDVKDMKDQDIALLAKQDKIDIAIDLTGYTQNNRSGIFAYRAAPVQINYLGYPGTMGAKFIDYIIADENLIPAKNQKFYSEKPIYLPHHYQAQDDTLPIACSTPSRLDLGLPENGFVFCAINNAYKITPDEFDIWMRLIKKVPNSTLMLLESNKWVKSNLVKEAIKREVNSSQLVFVQQVSHEKYLAQFQLADLYLDTFTYNAGATASNALWAGLPVLTKTGEGYASRMAGSLLTSIGLPELITTSKLEYEKLALEISTHPERLATIKEKLKKNRLSKPLFNTKLFTTHLENGYRMAHKRHLAGEQPETIYVPT